MKSKSKGLPKPRDPFVQHLINKKQGAHMKTYKSQRNKDKAQMKKDLGL
jgi:hypothetical protein